MMLSGDHSNSPPIPPSEWLVFWLGTAPPRVRVERTHYKGPAESRSGTVTMRFLAEG